MTVAARDTTVYGFYRLTRPVCPGTYYTRVGDGAVKTLVHRLQRRKSLTTENMRELNDGRLALKGKRILMCHRTRFTSLDGCRHESVGYIGVDPEYEFREVKRPPGYGRHTNGV
jgi:hypothetical protein